MTDTSIKQRITLEGAADAGRELAALGAAGTVVVNTFKTIGAELEAKVVVLGQVIGAFTAFGGALLALAKHASEATVATSHLAEQAGASITEMSGTLGALTNFGAKTDDLATGFKRLSVAIATVWPEIQKSVKDAAGTIIADQQAITKSTLGIESAQLSLFNARVRLGNLHGNATDPDILKAAEIKAATLAVAEAEARVAEAVQKRAEAVKKADEDQKNSIVSVAAAVKSVTDGVATFQEASAKANLNLDNVIKGLIVNTGPAVESLGAFKGSIADLGSQAPNVQAVFLKLASFFQNSGDAAQNTAIAFKLFGRGVQQDLIEAMGRGPAAIQAEIDRLKSLGLVLTDFDKTAGKGLEKAFNTLQSITSITTTQIGNQFAPAFTEGIKLLTTALEQSHGTILQFAQDFAARVKPVILDFFRILSGQKVETPWVQTIVTGATAVVRFLVDTLKPAVLDVFRLLNGEQVQTPWVQSVIDSVKVAGRTVIELGKTFGSVFLAIGGALDGIGGAINKTFGTNLKAADIAVALLAVSIISSFHPVAGALAAIVFLIDRISKETSQGLNLGIDANTKQAEALVAQLVKSGEIAKSEADEILNRLAIFKKATALTNEQDFAGTGIKTLKSIDATVAEELSGLRGRFKATGEAVAKEFANATGDIRNRTSADFNALSASAKASLERLAADGKTALGGIGIGAGAGAGAGQAAGELAKIGDAARTNAAAVALVNGQLQEIGSTIKVVTVGTDAWSKSGIAGIRPVENAFGEVARKAKEAGDNIDREQAQVPNIPVPQFDEQWAKFDKMKTSAETSVQEIAHFFEGLSTTISTAMSGVSGALTQPFQDSAKNILSALQPVLEFVNSLKTQIAGINVPGAGGLAGASAGGPVGAAAPAIDGASQPAETQFAKLKTDAETTVQEIAHFFGDLPGAIEAAVAGISDTLTEPFRQAASNINQALQSVLDFINNLKTQIAGINVPQGGNFGGQTGSPFASGGMVFGPGTATSDSILARLSAGEFVIRAKAVAHFGPQFFAALNNLKMPQFKLGGLVNSVALNEGLKLPKFNFGGLVTLHAALKNFRLPEFAAGGQVNWANRFDLPKFSFGGMVDNISRSFEALLPPIPHFADGGLALAPAAPTGRVTVDLRTNHGTVTVEASRQQFDNLRKLATLEKVRSAGRRQSSIS